MRELDYRFSVVLGSGPKFADPVSWGGGDWKSNLYTLLPHRKKQEYKQSVYKS